MKCPRCNSEMEKITFEQIEVDRCTNCKGLWFDKGEFEQAKDTEDADLSWMDFQLWSDQDAFETKWSSRKCPVCNKNMATVLYDDTDVMVDYCVQEHGIWLDIGEFEKIIESLQKEALSMSLPEYMAASLNEAKEIISGDEGFIHEWKDFRNVMRLLQYRVLADNPKLAKALIALSRSLPY